MTFADLQPKDKRQVDSWIDDLVGALCDPVIVFPAGGWENDLPDWIVPQIKLERLIMNMKAMNDGSVPVGDTEVLAYMYPRTMESPLTEQWNRIYMYVFNGAMKFKKTEVPEDLRSETLSNYDMSQLNDLKRFIYSKRVQHRKEKARTMKQETKEAKELEIKMVQPSFF
ncbi:MAG: hypothetical protein PHN78_08475 [Dehalococcoidales bacterium]|nr:hypothetical protein [Dehalococcoidales bacterium]